MRSTDLLDRKKVLEKVMSQTCPSIGFEGEKKGFPNLETLVVSGAGTKSRTRDPLITRSTVGSENHGFAGGYVF